MKKIILVTILVLLVCFAAFGVSQFGVDKAMQSLESQIAKQENTSVGWQAARAVFWPRPRIEISALELQLGEGAQISSPIAIIKVGLWQLLSGKTQPRALELQNPTITTPSKNIFAALVQTLQNKDLSTRLEGGRLEIINGTVVFADGQSITLPQISLTGSEKGKTINIDGNLTAEGLNNRLQIKLSAAPSTSPNLAWQLNASITSDLFDFSANGAIDAVGASFNGRAKLISPSLRSFMAYIGYPLHEGPGLSGVQAEGQVSFDPRGELNLRDLSVKVDGNEGSGALQIRTLQSPAAMQGTLAFDRLNLEPYLAKSNLSFSDFITNLNSWRSNWQVDVRLSAKTMFLGKEEGQFAGSVVINRAFAEFAIANTSFAAAEASGRVAVISPPLQSPEYAFSLDARQLKSNFLASGLGLQSEGLIDINLSGKASGFLTSNVRRSLEIKANVASPQLKLIGVDLAPTIQEVMQETKGSVAIAEPVLEATGNTLIEGLEMQALYKNQTLEVQSATGTIAGWLAAAQGSYATNDKRVDMQIDLSASSRDKIQKTTVKGRWPFVFWRAAPQDQSQTLQ